MSTTSHPVYRGIHYVSDKKLIWNRRKRGQGFEYLDENGKTLHEKEIERIKQLGIPPAWTDVRICPDEKGHLQATGLDAKERKQYIYHPDWVLYNQQHKFDYMVKFGEVLPTLREQIAADMRRHNLSRERMIATIVWLLEHTFIRIGNTVYEKENKSYGLTTLREKHMKVEGNTVKFSFKGKSGVYHHYDISHPRIVQTVKQCIELPGYKLFRYEDEQGEIRSVDSREVNEYMQGITGETLSAKDFRTWGGTVLAGDALYTIGSSEDEKAAEHIFTTVVDQVSEHLGNTAAVCRKYYIHPKVFESYSKNKLLPHFEKVYTTYHETTGKLSPHEQAAWTLIQS